jgi:hypothetical protein
MRPRLLAVLAACLSAACGPAGPTVMEFVEISPLQPRIGDVVTVRFRLLDAQGLPLAGQTVDFSLQNQVHDGITLSPTSVQSIQGSGYAETQVVVSTRVNSVIVVATAGDKQVTSPPITFAGTVPSAKQLTFQCGPISGTASGGRHAIGAYDETRNLIAGVKLECTAHTGDRNGDGVSGALVSFLTEAGTIAPTQTSVTDVVGNATVLYKTSEPLPQEVDPGVFTWSPTNDDTHTGEYLAPLWMHPYEWVENPFLQATTAPVNRVPTLREPHRPDPIRFLPDGTRYQNNPRDNLVTMIAVTTGEEAFEDYNNNGKYDPGEPFDDLTEPFVDSNDNGTWDEGELFIDVNGNKVWDGKNGKWDSSTLIWVEERILWTGMPAAEDSYNSVGGAAMIPVFAPVAPQQISLRCPLGIAVGAPCYQAAEFNGTALTGNADVAVSAYVADPWFNALARNGDADGCTIDVAGTAPVELKAGSNLGSAFTYPAGETLYFSVGDKRDPNAVPSDQVPKRQFPIAFSVPVACTYTASPKEGHVVKLVLGQLSGTID